MKRTWTRIFSFLLAAVMLASLIPASAVRILDDDARPAVPLGEEAVADLSAAETPADPADASAAADDVSAQLSEVALSIPGYTQVTQLNQIKAEREYLIVAQGGNALYALYPRLSNGVTAGSIPTTAANFGYRCARLSVSGQTVTATAAGTCAAAGAALNTAVSSIDTLLLKIAPSGSGYTFTSAANSNVKLQMDGTNNMFSGTVATMTVSFNAAGVLAVSSTSRYLAFSDASTEAYKHNTFGTDFWGPMAAEGAPIYLFIKGDLPVDIGSDLPQMLTGDQIGGGGSASNNVWTLTPDADPAGQNSWVFTGGRVAQGSFADVAGARNYVGHFEEYIRYTNAKAQQTSGTYESTLAQLQRHIINAAYTGQTLSDIVTSFNTRIAPLKPRAVAYLVEENGSTEGSFAANLNALIDSSLALRGNTGMLVIQTLTDADKTAVDAVVNALPNAKKTRVLPVKFTLTAAQKTGGFPNALGHVEMAKQLAAAVTGASVSGNSHFPYQSSGSYGTLDSTFPAKTTRTHDHTYMTPTSLNTAQRSVQTKAANTNTAMTWLFMGDSITHGAAWTGGFDSVPQSFEKFVKDDLGRAQDIVINAGSSGATTASTLNDLNRRLTKYSPDVVVLMLGTNDASGAVAEITYKTNLRTLLDAILAKGAIPVLRTPPPTSDRDLSPYAQYAREVATDVGTTAVPAIATKYADQVILVDQFTLWSSMTWNRVFNRGNTLHPDEAGQLWMTHQLIKELALWQDSYNICKLEYEEMDRLGSITIPGYTQVTDVEFNAQKGYLIVSQDAHGDLYALYPSADGESLGAGSLPSSTTDANNGARAAALTVSGETVSATWVKTGGTLDMKHLLFTVKADTANAGKYTFTAFNGRHLNMATQMLTEGTVSLAVTLRGTAAPNAFSIKNETASRWLNFTKNGDVNQFKNGTTTYGTDFWCPNGSPANTLYPIYLFASNTATVPTAKDGIQELIAAAGALREADYTRGSWRVLQTAKTAAQAALDSGEANGDAQSYVTARDALRDAIDGLVNPPTVTEPPAGATKKELSELRPTSGTSQAEPYAENTGGSRNFRIPAIITLKHQTGANASKNGRLVAAIDARWDHHLDAFSLDTMLSVSDDNGANWRYSFPIYFGDSTQTVQYNATTVIDPVLAEGADGTIYLMSDVFPGHTATYWSNTQSPAVATGYVTIGGVKRLALYSSPSSGNQTNDNYDYYVGDFENGYAPVMEPIDGDADIFSGFYVDDHYYLYKTSGAFAAKTPANDKIWCERLGESAWVQQNVFFWNASLHVRAAIYLWMIKSTDGGETWSAPQIVSEQVRTGANRFYGVGPGSGLCVETDNAPGEIPNGMVFLPTYTNDANGTERAGFVWSTDGTTWHRGPNATTDHSSESCLVQLDNTTVRHFYRDQVSNFVRYTDHTWNSATQTWTTGAPVTTGASKRSGNGCQLSAIKHSRKIDGKDVIIVSTPANNGTRAWGRLYVFLVNEDKTMDLYSTYSINGTGYYAYSSLSEDQNGDIALLYENAWTGDNGVAYAHFTTIPFNSIVPDLTATGYTGSYTGQSRSVAVTAPGGPTLQYSTDGGATWSADNPAFTNAGTNTVTVKAIWNGTDTGQITAQRQTSATVTINKVTPSLHIDTGNVSLKDGQTVTLTVEHVPAEATADSITLECSNTTTPGHDRSIALTKNSDGNYVGTHHVVEGEQTFTATFTGSANYNADTDTVTVTVSAVDFDVTVREYHETYDGRPHGITAQCDDPDVTFTFCDTVDGTYTTTPITYTDVGEYTVYYKATKTDGQETSGSADVTIEMATPTLVITCDKGADLSTTDLPLALTISGVPDPEQGKLTLTVAVNGEPVRNLKRDDATGSWIATPVLPPYTHSYTFVATFDPTQTQADTPITTPNYEAATETLTVHVTQPATGEPPLTFAFAEGVTIDDPASPTIGTLKVLYDGRPHSPAPALVYDEGLVLSYHIPDDEDAGSTWVSEVPTFTQPGIHTVTCMAMRPGGVTAQVLTVLLNIVVEDTPVSLTLTPSEDTFTGSGKLELTVTGLPEAGTVTVTCDPALTVTAASRGKYTVNLPNTTQTYIFSVEYSGAGSYQEAHASCTVSVTATATSSSSTRPTTATTVTTNDDGDKVTTVTDNRTGTVTETTEKPDGTVAVVETKKDGTVTEKVEEADGTKSETVTKPDGSKTATVEQPDGTKSETVVTAEGEATIIVTDPEGEELAKVEIPATIPEPETKFEDISTAPWAEEAINNVAGLELVKGIGGNKYDPIAPMTRGSLATVLHRLSQGKTDYDVTFKDVTQGKYYTEGVAWAAKANVVKGISADVFAPDDIITREQLAVMLARYAKLIGMNTKADTKALEAFNDGDSTGTWAVDGVAWCVANGILQGKGQNNLDPTANVSRAEVAVMLDRFIALLK